MRKKILKRLDVWDSIIFLVFACVMFYIQYRYFRFKIVNIVISVILCFGVLANAIYKIYNQRHRGILAIVTNKYLKVEKTKIFWNEIIKWGAKRKYQGHFKVSLTLYIQYGEQKIIIENATSELKRAIKEYIHTFDKHYFFNEFDSIILNQEI